MLIMLRPVKLVFGAGFSLTSVVCTCICTGRSLTKKKPLENSKGFSITRSNVQNAGMALDGACEILYSSRRRSSRTHLNFRNFNIDLNLVKQFVTSAKSVYLGNVAQRAKRYSPAMMAAPSANPRDLGDFVMPTTIKGKTIMMIRRMNAPKLLSEKT